MSLIVISRNIAAPTRALPNTFWYTRLPDNTTLLNDVNLNITSASAIAELVRQSQMQQPIVNVASWTSHTTIVPASLALVPVTCSHDSLESAIGATGIPIPSDVWVPPNPPDTDRAVIILQPTAPQGGFMWEMQGFSWVTPGIQAACNSLSRMSGAMTRGTGHFVDWVTGPGSGTPSAIYSTYEQKVWGIQGSGVPYSPGMLTAYDYQRGYVDHALLMEVVDARAGAHYWPAVARSDGGSSSANLVEGMWLRLPAGYVIPPNLSKTTRLFMQAARDFGIILTDRTLSCIAVRADHDCLGMLDDGHLTGFPFADMQVMNVGSDSLWHP